MKRDKRRNDTKSIRKTRKASRRSIVQSLACLVVFCTTYALILPAITLERPTYCGIKEHTHSDKCYTMQLVCGQEEGEGHTHDDSCYTEHQNLICGLEESEGHTHTDECYQTYDNLICELEENEEHTHGPECYEQVTELVCPLEETEGHTHTEACYETVRELSCTLEESKGHTHTEKCYEKVLTCKKEEHEHSLQCYADPKADLETQAQWEETLPKKEELTGVWAEDLLKVAESQLDYKESDRNYQVVDEEPMGYTRYGAYLGMPYEDWCAMFIEFCLHYADIPKEDMPRASSCSKWEKLLTKNDMFLKAEDGRPEPGDLVFFDIDEYEGPDHVGIVTEVDEKDGIKTIEGNCGNKVAHREYKWDDKTLYGYGLLPENPNPEGTEKTAEEEAPQATVEFTAETETMTVRVEAPEGAFPEGTTMEVKNVAAEDVMDAVTDAVDGEIAHVDAVDITFYHEGKEIEPALPIQVFMQPKENNQEGTPKILHLQNDGTTEPVENKADSETNEEPVQFEADSFSVYALVYTVDFHWEVDGKTYELSLPGGSYVSLEQLFEALAASEKKNEAEVPQENALALNDVEVSTETKKFTAEVETVEFTDPSLLWVGKIENDTTVGAIKQAERLDVQYSEELTEDQIAAMDAQTLAAGDWALISLQAFDTEEYLTVTMKNGDQFKIKVTDGQLQQYVISASGDTYEITVTYDDSAEIPEGAELAVREILADSKEYAENVALVNEKVGTEDEPAFTNPAQFDISIVSGGVKVEPKKGSVVKVEIKLAKSLLGEVASIEEDSEESSVPEEETGLFLYNGQVITLDTVALNECTVAHIAEDGTAEIIEKVESSEADDKIVMQFETESFSDYLFDTTSDHSFNNLPSTIYVGDEIYMWNQADYWVTNIGSVVSETKHNNGWDPDGWGQAQPDDDNFKTVTALQPGKFRIVHRNDWNNGNPYRNYKEITVLPARTGTTPPATIDTINNASIGLTLNLFDYDLDNYLDDYYNGSSHYDNTCIADFVGHGINSGNALKFWGSGIGNNYGSLNQYVEHGVTSIVNTTLNSSGYPVLSNNSGGQGNRDLSYLFTPSDGTDKKAYTNVDGLFKKDGDYYVYDSNQNYAYYDTSQGPGGRFAVYNSTYNQKSGGENGSVQNKSIGFFPFHPWDNEYDLYVNWNKNLNHHFGMSMSVPFSLPKDPKAVVDTNGDPIIFEFSGDDDLWVFIDGKLAMDIGGIHQPTSGTINFQNGTVKVNGQDQTGFNFSNLYDGKKHTLQVFYIERGGCDSNCKIKFNLTQYGDIHFDKVDKDNPSEALAGAVFGIYKDESCTDPLMENLKNRAPRAYIAESDANGHVQFSDIPLGTYYMKELHAPEGYPLDSTIHTVRVFLENGEVKVRVTIDGHDVADGVKITNKKPAPINLGLKKEWQNQDEQTITAPNGVTATFEIKRIRTYETYTEQVVEGEGRETSHLTVGWIHNGESHVYGEYDLIAGSQTTVSWGYKDGYTGSKDCVLNGTRVDKDYVAGNIVSEAFSMPAVNGSATFYIIDDSDAGEAISSINVAGQQFYGNSGGGVIHTFQTIREPDPDFSYTGDNVIDNRVTLPINESTWQYIFNALPTFGRGNVTGVDHEVAFNYSYYLEEVSRTSPEGTTVVYKDINGNIIDSPTAGETSSSGTQTIINRIPYGYLEIQKQVTYNGSSENLTSAQKSKMAGEYKFKIYTTEQCAAADAVQDPNAAADAEDKDLIITITIGEDGQAVSSDKIKLLAGNYWIKEVDSSNPMMFPVQNPIAVTVTKYHTTSDPVITTLTNNYDENNGPDKISIDIEKKFQGLDSSNQVPANFQVSLQYKVNGQTKTVTLQNNTATGENGETITWSTSSDGFTWHWKVGNIDNSATDFKIKEINQDNVSGYDWKNAYLNGTGAANDITSTVTDYHDLSVTAPLVEFGKDVKAQRITSDSEYNRAFFLLDDDILLTALTANQGSLVISKKPLNLLQRKAVEAHWPGQGSIKPPGVYFSIEEHPNGFTYDKKKIVFGEEDGKTVVKFTSNASSNEAIFVASYTTQEAYNIANLVNTYEEVPITIDIEKVKKDNDSVKLPGAVFTIRQLADLPPTENGTFTTLGGTTPSDSIPTNEEGKTSFGNLTHGYYELTEKKCPDGYVNASEIVTYFKIQDGVVTWLTKGDGKPSDWQKKNPGIDGKITFASAILPDAEHSITAKNAKFTIENEPGIELPHTGGRGTQVFTCSGLILMAAVTLLYGYSLRRRRKGGR